MNIDRDLSRRIEALRLPLIVGVVFIHAYLEDLGTSAGPTSALPDFLQNLVSQSLARIAVPLFYVISGLLFFRDFEPTLGSYRRKLSSRVRTLLVPYLIWNTLVLLIHFGAESSPFSGYLSGNRLSIDDVNMHALLAEYLALDSNPAAYHLWFIRDLILMVVVAPLFWLGARYAPRASLLLLFAPWMLGVKYGPGRVSIEAMLFFLSGAALAVQRVDLRRLDSLGIALPAVWIALSLLDASAETFRLPLLPRYLHKMAILVGTSAAWLLPLIAVRSRAVEWARRGARHAFFVYAAHGPVLTVLKKLSREVLGIAQTGNALAGYLLPPLVCLGAALLASSILMRLWPGLYGVLTGRRMARLSPLAATEDRGRPT